MTTFAAYFFDQPYKCVCVCLVCVRETDGRTDGRTTRHDTSSRQFGMWIWEVGNEEWIVDIRLPWWWPYSSSSVQRPWSVVVHRSTSYYWWRVVRLQRGKCCSVSASSNYRLKHHIRTALSTVQRTSEFDWIIYNVDDNKLTERLCLIK